MGHSRALKLLLKRGALIAAANWPVVLVQFVADTVFNALLAVPVAGGVLLVMLLVGAEPAELMRLPYREIIPALISALVAQPVALARSWARWAWWRRAARCSCSRSRPAR